MHYDFTQICIRRFATLIGKIIMFVVLNWNNISIIKSSSMTFFLDNNSKSICKNVEMANFAILSLMIDAAFFPQQLNKKRPSNINSLSIINTNLINCFLNWVWFFSPLLFWVRTTPMKAWRMRMGAMSNRSRERDRDKKSFVQGKLSNV